MLGRLGNVLYWGFAGLAAVAAIFSVVIIVAGAINERSLWDTGTVTLGFLISAAVIWLFGRACRYVLAGK